MKPKSVLEQLANQYTLPGGSFYMDEQGTIQTVENIAELKKYLMIKGATQVVFVKSIDRFVESDSSGVADEVNSWASTHPKRRGYRWVLQTVATASSSVAPYMDFNKEGGGTVRLTFGSDGQPIFTILSCLMLLFSSITGYAQSARTSPLIDRTTHVLVWPTDFWTANSAGMAGADLNRVVIHRTPKSTSAATSLFSEHLANGGLQLFPSDSGGVANRGAVTMTESVGSKSLSYSLSRVDLRPTDLTAFSFKVATLGDGVSAVLLDNANSALGIDGTGQYLTPYVSADVVTTNDTTTFNTTGAGEVWMFCGSRNLLVPASGWYSKVKFQFNSGTAPEITSCKVLFAEKLSSGHVKVLHQSEELASQQSWGGGTKVVYELTFARTWVPAGALIGLKIVGTASRVWTCTGSSTGNSVEYYSGTPGNVLDITTTIVASTRWMVNVYGETPPMATLGDSLMVGQHTGGIGLANTSVQSAVEDAFAIPCMGGGVGSQTTYDIAGRVTSAGSVRGVEDAFLIRANGGVNDLAGGTNKTDFIANWTTILNALQGTGQYVVVDAILPWTAGTNGQMQSRDEWNTDLAALCAGYTNVLFINHDSVLGLFRAGGDAGNLWDIAVAYRYAGDSVHLNAAGYAAREANAATLTTAWLKTKNVIW